MRSPVRPPAGVNVMKRRLSRLIGNCTPVAVIHRRKELGSIENRSMDCERPDLCGSMEFRMLVPPAHPECNQPS
jgi:hypothetical protein